MLIAQIIGSGGVIAALLGLLLGAFGTLFIYRLRHDELFFQALQFLGGGSKNRGLGISAIQSYWEAGRHRQLCIPLLIGTAIELLLNSEESDTASERFNLNRVMEMLTADKHPSPSQLKNYGALKQALADKKANPGTGGIEVPAWSLDGWIADCDKIIGNMQGSH